jgi:site-specific DNA-methyltransferase (adenine-specific)
MGILITLEAPTREMEKEVVLAGLYHSPGWNRDYPKLQILTIADLLGGAQVQMPPASMTFKQAEKIKPANTAQGELV